MQKKKNLRGPLFFIVLLVAAIVLATVTMGTGANASVAKKEEITYTQFLDEVRKGNVEAVLIVENDLVGIYADSQAANGFAESPTAHYDFKTRVPDSDSFYSDVRAVLGDESLSSLDFGFDITMQGPAQASWWQMIMPYVLMLGALGLIWFFIMRQQNKANGGMNNFGKSTARRHQAGVDNNVTFKDVAGADEEKEELEEVVEFLKNPQRFRDLGARIPKGVLLVGPPGTGKTLLAKAVAGEAGVPFFSISGSDFVEMFVGVGASRVRSLFEEAKKNQPAIIFIDEIDAVGRKRGSGLGGGHDEREQTLNQLLVEMDGFTVNQGIIIIAATNRADILDPALLRPGRFDRQITVGYPDVKGREEILRVHAKNKPLEDDVKLDVLAKMTPWNTGADLENILNEAAILAARKKKTTIGMTEITEAVQRVELGPEKKSRKVTEQDRRLVAFHEAGHAIVAFHLEHCDPVQEVSIIPRGSAGGYTQTLPNEDTSFMSRAKMVDRITMAMGGNAAEELVNGDVTTGAVGDLKMATQLARSMVTEYGMSPVIGHMYLGSEQEVFIGRDFSQQVNYSNEVAAVIDEEVRKILEHGYRDAKTILTNDFAKLHQVAEYLLDREKITGEEFEAVMRGQMLAEDETVEEEVFEEESTQQADET